MVKKFKLDKNVDVTIIIDNKKRNLNEFRLMEVGAMVAIAFYKPLWNEIDSIYKEHEVECINAYRNSDFSKMNFYKLFTAQIENILIKVASIYAWKETMGEEDKWMMYCLKKGYKRYVDYVQRSPYFDWEEFANYAKKRNPNFNELKLDLCLYVAIYTLGENFDFDDPLSETLLQKVISYFLLDFNKHKFFGNIESYETELDERLKKILGFSIKKNINFLKMSEKQKEYLIEYYQITDDEDAKKIFDNNRLYSSLHVLDYIISYHGYDPKIFKENTEITKKDLLIFYRLFKFMKEENQITDEYFELFLTACLNHHMMTKQYRILSDYYKDLRKKEEELLLKETEISREKGEIYQTKLKTSSVINNLKKELSLKEERILELERLLKQNEQDQKEFHSLKQEVVALREYVFQNQQQYEQQEDTSIELDTSLLKKQKIAVIGGHQRFHQRLKEKYPNIRTIHPDELNIDFSFLKNMDLVCIETSYNNHSIYRKAMKEIEKSAAQLYFINVQNNIEKLEKELLNLIQ